MSSGPLEDRAESKDGEQAQKAAEDKLATAAKLQRLIPKLSAGPTGYGLPNAALRRLRHLQQLSYRTNLSASQAGNLPNEQAPTLWRLLTR